MFELKIEIIDLPTSLNIWLGAQKNRLIISEHMFWLRNKTYFHLCVTGSL